MSFKSNLKSQEIEETLQNVLRKDNTAEFTPTSDYQPATKKYVDSRGGIHLEYETLDSIETDKQNILDIIENNSVDILIKQAEINPGERSITFHFNKGNTISQNVPIYYSYTEEGPNTYIVSLEINSMFACSIHEGYIDRKFITVGNADDNTVIPTDINLIRKIGTMIDGNTDPTAGHDQIFPIFQKFLYEDNRSGMETVGYDYANRRMVSIKYFEGDSTSTITYYNMPLYQVLTESEYSALGETVNTDNVLYFVTPDAE